ncbi:hypothetical protein [Streptomyces niveus]|uniref:hypothetical protein n=1 Tax=Streptomyces niveus TaxID=193462 RepID=UPI003697C463
MALLPPPDYIAEQATPERPANPGYVYCELGGDHDGDHAQFLWDEDVKGGAVWVQWNADRRRLVVLPWCAVHRTDRDEACGFFANHQSAHSWDVEDPTREALKVDLAREYPHLFPSESDQDTA